jgi:hypothetical protein
MSEMERSILDSRKKEHEAIVKVVSNLNQMGFLINGVWFKNGALEVICYPPEREKGAKKKLQEAIEAGYGTDDNALSMDGVSETFKD